MIWGLFELKRGSTCSAVGIGTPAGVEMSPASAGRMHTQAPTNTHKPRCGKVMGKGLGSVGH